MFVLIWFVGTEEDLLFGTLFPLSSYFFIGQVEKWSKFKIIVVLPT